MNDSKAVFGIWGATPVPDHGVEEALASARRNQATIAAINVLADAVQRLRSDVAARDAEIDRLNILLKRGAGSLPRTFDHWPDVAEVRGGRISDGPIVTTRPTNPFAAAVAQEVAILADNVEPVRSLMEGSAIIRSHLDDFWYQVRRDEVTDEQNALMRQILVQLAAACQRTAENCGLSAAQPDAPTTKLPQEEHMGSPERIHKAEVAAALKRHRPPAVAARNVNVNQFLMQQYRDLCTAWAEVRRQQERSERAERQRDDLKEQLHEMRGVLNALRQAKGPEAPRG